MPWLSRLIAALAVALLMAGVAQAVQPDEVLSDPALEARARAISGELRCLVCQNQSIDDSDAQLAKDLRLLVRERLKAGDSDAQVEQFLVDRYGEFVLLRPRFEWRTAASWILPFAVPLVGGLVCFLILRRRNRTVPPPAPLSADEEKRVAEILREG